VRRIIVIAVVVLLVVVVAGSLSALQDDTSQANVVTGTVCPTNTVNELVAQSVPSASLVPCVSLFGGRWSVDGEAYSSDGTTVSMSGQDSADVTWTVTLHESCDTAGMVPAGSAEGADMAQSASESGSTYTRDQAFTFEGGCVTSTLKVPSRYDRALIESDVDAALVLVSRSALNDQVAADTDGKLQLDP
jgi:hypothetical protein